MVKFITRIVVDDISVKIFFNLNILYGLEAHVNHGSESDFKKQCFFTPTN